MTNPDDPVFGATTIPDGVNTQKGMKVIGITKIEYFSGLAMQGIISSPHDFKASDNSIASSPEGFALVSVLFAKALIEELNKETSK